MPRHNKNIILTPLDMCRICLNDRREVYIDVMGPNEPHLLQHVKDYYRVDITGSDGKSTKLCQYCVEFIDIWQGHIEKARECQMIVNYLAEKRYMLPASTSQRVSKRSSSVPNKKKKTTSRRSKKRKRFSTIPKHEMPSTSNDHEMPSTSNYHQMPSTSNDHEMPSTSNDHEMPSTSNYHQMPSTSNDHQMPCASTSNDHQMPCASTSNDMTQSPLESIQPSTSASGFQCSTIDSQYVSDFNLTSSSSDEIIPFTSTTTEIIPFASTSAENIPIPSTSTETIPFASTSAEFIPFTSTSTEFIPIQSTSTEFIPIQSTSTEIIPFPSMSTEIIPFAQSSTEIVPSYYTINEISSTGDNPIWYSNGNGITEPESEDFKPENVCIFCTYQHEEVSPNAYKHILFCPKHSNPYACPIENCHSVFPNKPIFIQHYRTHLNLNSSTFVCNICFSVLTCSRRSVTADHTHQNDLFKCCSLNFTTMTKLVLHKLINHCAIVVSSHNQSRTLQKQNLNINNTELENVVLDVPGTVPCSQKMKDNGSFMCYSCSKYFNNIPEFTEHTKVKHKNLITLKDKGIKFCPLCDHSYFNEQYSEHVENCINTFKVGKDSNNYGCVHCSVIFTNVSPREIRNHVMYCKSFRLIIINNKINHKCINCSFKSTDDDSSLMHANSNCIYLKLQMRYALGPDEKMKVTRQMEFVKHNTKQQEDEDRTNDDELFSSNTVCNTARQKMLKFYKFFCNNCKNLFFNMNVFFKHLTPTGDFCRLQSLVYCQKCLTEFKTFEEYRGHLPSMPEASPILLPIKQELFGQNNDEYDNGILPMEVVRFNPNQYGVKVEMNNETFYQKQEPIDETSDMQYQEQELELEQEQEQAISNNDPNNCYFSCSEMELTANDLYMQCEVEEKPDLNQLLENVE